MLVHELIKALNSVKTIHYRRNSKKPTAQEMRSCPLASTAGAQPCSHSDAFWSWLPLCPLAPGQLVCSALVAGVVKGPPWAQAQAARRVRWGWSKRAAEAMLCKMPPRERDVVRSRQCVSIKVTPEGAVWLKIGLFPCPNSQMTAIVNIRFN